MKIVSTLVPMFATIALYYIMRPWFLLGKWWSFGVVLFFICVSGLVFDRSPGPGDWYFLVPMAVAFLVVAVASTHRK